MAQKSDSKNTVAFVCKNRDTGMDNRSVRPFGIDQSFCEAYASAWV